MFAHGELAPKRCPGPAVNMSAIRTRLRQRLAAEEDLRPGVTFDTRRLLRRIGVKLSARELDALFRFWRASGVTRILVAGHWGMDDPGKVSELIRFVDSATAAGFPVLLYTGPFGTERSDFLREHPEAVDWQQRSQDGAPLTYGGLHFFCPNSPYLQQYRGPLIRELLKRYTLSGLFLDIPWFLRSGCYCRWCQAVSSEKPVAGVGFKQRSIRKVLSEFLIEIRNSSPSAYLAVNANAPGTPWTLEYTGAGAKNLSGLFDEVVTEFTPMAAGSRGGGEVVETAIRAASSSCPGAAQSHACLLDHCSDPLPATDVEQLVQRVRRAGAGVWFSAPCFTPSGWNGARLAV